MHRLPFEDHSRVLGAHERRRESLEAHHGSEDAKHHRPASDRSGQDEHEPHGDTKRACRVDSAGRREVRSPQHRHAIGIGDANDAGGDRDDTDEQRGSKSGLREWSCDASSVLWA
jgi:hypothetical protein